MNGHLSRILLYLYFSVAAAALIAGCSGASSSGRKSRSPRHAHSSAGSRGMGDDVVAEETQSATRNRRGTWSLTSEQVQEVAALVERNAAAYGLPPDLIYGIIWVESRFNTKAVSSVGARGLMQLMPRTADYLAECIEWEGRRRHFDPAFNVAAGSYYIARLIREFDGDVTLALAAYNAGPAKVRHWVQEGGLPEVSVAYAAMVETARTFFRDAKTPSPELPEEAAPPITDEALDRLGLTILIAGSSDKPFGLEREDDSTPFE